MASVTVVEIIERAKAAADMTDNFVTSTQWLRWLNVENRRLEAFIARTGYVLHEKTQVITADGSQGYSISPEPMVILGVYEYKSNRLRRLKHSDLMDGAGLTDLNVVGPAQTFRFAQTDDDVDTGEGNLNLFFFPAPAEGTYLFQYIAIPETLAIDGIVSYPANIEERLVLGLARRALAKEESATSELTRQITEQDQYIEEFCFDRLFGAHQQIRNVDRVERGWLPYPQIPTSQFWMWVA